MIKFKEFFRFYNNEIINESKFTHPLEINNSKKLPKYPPYGFWMDRSGNLEVVKSWAEHDTVARRLIIPQIPDDVSAHDILLKKGWVRIVKGEFNQFLCDYNISMTPAQQRMIKNIREVYPEIKNHYEEYPEYDYDGNYMGTTGGYVASDKYYKESVDGESPFAVFVVYQYPDGKIAATTRPKDRASDDKGVKFGLPGGKVDPGEDPEEAAIRESGEEGWEVSGLTFKHSDMVQGKPVWWYHAKFARPLREYKEKYRGIIPTKVDISELMAFGNERAIPASLS
jgi:hypothetical protein